LEKSKKKKIDALPKCFRLGWAEQFIYISLKEKLGFKFLIFETKNLELVKIIPNLPSYCPEFKFKCPIYSEYFAMKLLLFQRTYLKIIDNISENYEYFKISDQKAKTNKNYNGVSLIRSNLKSKAE
jgi:hypothetical protein